MSSAAERLAEALSDAALSSDGRLLAVLGDPIAHSLSPALHGAALARHGLPHRYVKVRCAQRELAALVTAARRLPVLGFNLTAPLKETVIPLLDDTAPLARAVGAVNTVTRDGERLVGHNTDVYGFLTALREETGFDPHAAVATVLGAGGAARAVVAGLLDAGAARVIVVGRDRVRAERLRADLSGLATAGALDVAFGFANAPAQSDLVVQCTPLGLDAAQGSAPWVAARGACAALPWDAWADRGAVAYDLNYRPRVTAFLDHARSRSLRFADGLGMLVHQAALAFESWTGLGDVAGVMRGALGA